VVSTETGGSQGRGVIAVGSYRGQLGKEETGDETRGYERSRW
jgi:hypothetical protein